MKTIVIASSKGGSTKTTTSSTLARILSKMDFKTLLIDADLQCNSSDLYRAETNGATTLFDVILDDNPVDINEAIQHTDNGDIIAGDPLLRKADIILAGDPDGAHRLQDALKKLKGYDYVIIDTAPAINIMLHNALVAADDVIIPITADRFAIQGISELSTTIHAIKNRQNTKLNLAGILLCKYHDKQSLDKSILEGLEQISEQIGTKVFETKIRECAKVRQSQTVRKQLIDYAPACTTARDYWKFTEELING